MIRGRTVLRTTIPLLVHGHVLNAMVSLQENPGGSKCIIFFQSDSTFEHAVFYTSGDIDWGGGTYIFSEDSLKISITEGTVYVTYEYKINDRKLTLIGENETLMLKPMDLM